MRVDEEKSRDREAGFRDDQGRMHAAGAGRMQVKDFKEFVDANIPQELVDLKNGVQLFFVQFPTIGFEKSSMRYKEAGTNWMWQRSI